MPRTVQILREYKSKIFLFSEKCVFPLYHLSSNSLESRSQISQTFLISEQKNGSDEADKLRNHESCRFHLSIFFDNRMERKETKDGKSRRAGGKKKNMFKGYT